MAVLQFDLGEVEAALDAIEQAELTARDWDLIGQRAVVLILERTERGLNGYGLPFARYAPSTAKRRQRAGRSPTIVTLAYSGRMMASLTATGIKDGVRLSFVNARAQELAERHIQGTRKMPSRNMLAIPERTNSEKVLATYAARLLINGLRAALRVSPEAPDTP